MATRIRAVSGSVVFIETPLLFGFEWILSWNEDGLDHFHKMKFTASCK